MKMKKIKKAICVIVCAMITLTISGQHTQCPIIKKKRNAKVLLNNFGGLQATLGDKNSVGAVFNSQLRLTKTERYAYFQLGIYLNSSTGSTSAPEPDFSGAIGFQVKKIGIDGGFLFAARETTSDQNKKMNNLALSGSMHYDLSKIRFSIKLIKEKSLRVAMLCLNDSPRSRAVAVSSSLL